MNELQSAWIKFQGTVSGDGEVSAIYFGLALLASGLLSWYVRILYRKCATTPTDTDSISRVFPMLAIVTTGTIFVVKSSLALSLGLVGALSIVRFRAAIKEPEELVYLFLCIGIGLSMGAEQPLLAVALVIAATLFSFSMAWNGRHRNSRLLLTVTGNSEQYFSAEEPKVLNAIMAVAGKYTLQRIDIDSTRGQVRVSLPESDSKKTGRIVTDLRGQLPGCEVSFVNLNSQI